MQYTITLTSEQDSALKSHLTATGMTLTAQRYLQLKVNQTLAPLMVQSASDLAQKIMALDPTTQAQIMDAVNTATAQTIQTTSIV